MKMSTWFSAMMLATIMALASGCACGGGGDDSATDETVKDGEKKDGEKKAGAKFEASKDNKFVKKYEPYWAEIAECKTYATYNDKDCPRLHEIHQEMKKAKDKMFKAKREKKDLPKKWNKIHEALINQVINGKDDRARDYAARLSYDGGEFVTADKEGLAMQLLDAYEERKKETGYEWWGVGISQMLGAFWKKDNKVRKRMLSLVVDKTPKFPWARKNLIEKQRLYWDVRGDKAFDKTYKKVAKDKKDDKWVRKQAILAIGDSVAKRPKQADLLMTFLEDTKEDLEVRRGTFYGLGEIKGDDDRRKKARKLVFKVLSEETKHFGVGGSAVACLADLGSAKSLEKVAELHKKQDTAESGDMLCYAVQEFGRKEYMQEKDGKEAMVKAAKAALKSKASEYRKPYVFDGLVKVGGKKVKKLCEAEEKNADKRIAKKAKECSDKLKKEKKK